MSKFNLWIILFLIACSNGGPLQDFGGRISDEWKRAGWFAGRLDNGPVVFHGMEGQPRLWVIQCLKGGKVVDVPGTTNGDRPRMWDRHNEPWQQWRLIKVADGEYEIRSKPTGKCLEVAGGNKDNGASVQIWNCHGHAWQRWRLSGVRDGYVKIINMHTGRVLDVAGGNEANGAQLHQWESNNNPQQLFKFIPL